MFLSPGSRARARLQSLWKAFGRTITFGYIGPIMSTTDLPPSEMSVIIGRTVAGTGGSVEILNLVGNDTQGNINYFTNNSNRRKVALQGANDGVDGGSFGIFNKLSGAGLQRVLFLDNAGNATLLGALNAPTVSASVSATTPIHYGGTATNSSVTVQATSNVAPSGEVANVKATTINLSRNAGGTVTTVNVGTANLTSGIVSIAGGGGGATSIQAPTGTWTLTLPANGGSVGQFLQTDGTGVGSWANPLTIKVQKFTASGTYTPSPGLVYCIIECQGSGAGGGGATGSAANGFYGGGGGAGSYSRAIVSAAAVGASQVVTVGTNGTGGVGSANGTNGSDVSVGSLCIGKGGTGGIFSASGTFGTGGAGGIAGTGDLPIPGGAGSTGFVFSVASGFGVGGDGGNSLYGMGGKCLNVSGGAQNGTAGSLYGGGGSGAAAQNTAAAATGGAGAKGIVFITEFCNR